MERNVYLPPTENISFREGNLLCAGCKASGHADKAINNMAHRVTEGTEVKPILQRCRRHKEQRRCSVQIPDTF